jgi:putative hydrolases of HD superfamily
MDFKKNHLPFFIQAEKLKVNLRHCWTSDKNRQESVAEHCWQMALLFLTLRPYLRHSVEESKVFKLITIHDLPEAITGDIPAWTKKGMQKEEKLRNERKALDKMIMKLPSSQKEEFMSLWLEYTEKKTREALLVKMMDILDVLFQHWVGDIRTWSKEEFEFNVRRNSQHYFENEPELLNLYNEFVDLLELKKSPSSKGKTADPIQVEVK